jgi:glyoxylase-like metal-dependent hydrolase (beta-lactamase superfamily II)
MISFDVCPGVHLIEHGRTNCYVIEADTGVLLVDAAYPRTWRLVERALTSLGGSPSDIRGLVITHGHFDHVGFATRLQREHGVGVWAHPADFPITRHPYRYHPQKPRLLYPIAYPRSIPVLSSMVAAGALRVPGVVPDHTLSDGDTLDLPGAPQVICTPGHTDGECVLWLADRGVLLTGDALVTLDPYTGLTGPRIIARAATHDRRQALASLEPLTGLPVDKILPGHGEVWSGEIAAAVGQARVNYQMAS